MSRDMPAFAVIFERIDICSIGFEMVELKDSCMLKIVAIETKAFKIFSFVIKQHVPKLPALYITYGH